MRIQLTILVLLFSFNAFSTDDKSMQELFRKYDAVMDQKKIELIEEVFTRRFINDSGGKKELIEKINELTTPPNPPKTQMSWKKGHKGKMYLAKVKELTPPKSKESSHETEFIVIKEDGKLKINGTISDGD